MLVSPEVPRQSPTRGKRGAGPGRVAGAGGKGRVWRGWGPHRSAVDWGMRSGILVSFRLEHSTTPASQRHLWGQATSLLHSLFSW